MTPYDPTTPESNDPASLESSNAAIQKTVNQHILRATWMSVIWNTPSYEKNVLSFLAKKPLITLPQLNDCVVAGAEGHYIDLKKIENVLLEKDLLEIKNSYSYIKYATGAQWVFYIISLMWVIHPLSFLCRCLIEAPLRYLSLLLDTPEKALFDSAKNKENSWGTRIGSGVLWLFVATPQAFINLMTFLLRAVLDPEEHFKILSQEPHTIARWSGYLFSGSISLGAIITVPLYAAYLFPKFLPLLGAAINHLPTILIGIKVMIGKLGSALSVSYNASIIVIHGLYTHLKLIGKSIAHGPQKIKNLCKKIWGMLSKGPVTSVSSAQTSSLITPSTTSMGTAPTAGTNPQPQASLLGKTGTHPNGSLTSIFTPPQDIKPSDGTEPSNDTDPNDSVLGPYMQNLLGSEEYSTCKPFA